MEKICQAAVELVDAEGLDALTMRRLGAALSVEAMSLYTHVASKAALCDAIIDHVLSAVEPPDRDDPLEFALEFARSYRAALIEHPNLLPLLARRRQRPADEAGVVQRDRAITTARTAGLDPAFAEVAYMTVVSFVVGHVITHAGYLDGSRSRTGAHTRRKEADRVFEEGLSALVDGLLLHATANTQ